MNDINICCNNMICAIRSKDIIINDGACCLGKSEYKLKESTKGVNKAIIIIYYCPWCSKYLKSTSEEIKGKILVFGSIEIKRKEGKKMTGIK